METTNPNRRRTLAARQALAAQFPSPEAKTEYYRQLGRKAAASRVVLRAEDAQAVRQAYELLGRLAARLPDVVGESDPPPEQKESAPAGESGAEEGGR